MSDNARSARIEALNEMRLSEVRYTEQFGEDSLARVSLCDPIHTPHARRFRAIARYLDYRVKKNKPIEQCSEEDWDAVVFC